MDIADASVLKSFGNAEGGALIPDFHGEIGRESSPIDEDGGGNNEKETPSESNFRDSRASSDFNFVVSRDRQSNIMPAKMLSKEKKRGK